MNKIDQNLKSIKKPTLRKIGVFTLFCLCLNIQVVGQSWKDFRPKPEPCGEVYIDILKGTINGMGPRADYLEVRKAFPACMETLDAMERMNDTEEHISSSVGFRFFFDVDMVEVWRGFKGETSVRILGRKTKALDALFGVAEISGDFHRIYKTDYGSLYVNLSKNGKVELFSMHAGTAKETEELICMDSRFCR